MSSARRRQITSETCTLAGMLSSFFGSVLAIVSNTPRAHGAANSHLEPALRQEGPRTLDASKVSLEPENPRRVAPRVPKSETAGNCFVAWSRVELLTDRVERESQPVRRLLWITGL